MKALLSILLCLSCPAFAGWDNGNAGPREGWDNGNAGDTYVYEFVLSARDVVERIEKLPAKDLVGIDLELLKQKIATVVVQSTDEVLTWEGQEVDAKNFPEKNLIVLNRARWERLRFSSETKRRLALALHEFLPMAGVPDQRWNYSTALIEKLDILGYDPSRFWNPLNPVNAVATQLEYTEADCLLPNLRFNTTLSEETVEAVATGNCGDAFRKVVANKTSFTPPASTGAKGTAHRFDISVLDRNGTEIGALSYIPEFYECVYADKESCAMSGTLAAGGVMFKFWRIPN